MIYDRVNNRHMVRAVKPSVQITELNRKCVHRRILLIIHSMLLKFLYRRQLQFLDEQVIRLVEQIIRFIPQFK